jgi:hypothetical protein
MPITTMMVATETAATHWRARLQQQQQFPSQLHSVNPASVPIETRILQILIIFNIFFLIGKFV